MSLRTFITRNLTALLAAVLASAFALSDPAKVPEL